MTFNLNDREKKESKIGSVDNTLSDLAFEPMLITDMFHVHNGSGAPKKENGRAPYVAASFQNNGVVGYVDAAKYQGGWLSLVKDGDGGAGKCFYQPAPFWPSNHVFALKPKTQDLTEGALLCVATLITHQCFPKYSRGNAINVTRLSRQKIMLPVTRDDQPDWQSLEQHAKAILDKKKSEYEVYAKKALAQIEYREVEPLDEKEWKEFAIGAVTTISPGKRLTKSDMTPGNKPFIGASDSNNGITAFVSNTNESQDRNVLGINYNGSVAESFYHPYTAIFTDDVKRLSLNEIEGNKYHYLFLKNAILQQKSKYQYAYKLNEARLKKQKVMLPVNASGNPDWQYMEQYAKNLYRKKIIQYLAYLDASKDGRVA